jgi:hypothetical protein
MSAAQNKFVFVVCGTRVHIDTLHYSLAALKLVTANPILVVTDLARNDTAIQHNAILNITTPAHLNHHQASIYLKTGLHQFLPQGNNYCYLDTDVIALSTEVDNIFNQKQGPVTFAADHCSLAQFSPHAVQCNCVEQYEKDREQIAAMLKQYGYNPPAIQPSLLHKQHQLKHKFEVLKRSKLQLLKTAIRFSLASSVFKLEDDILYNKTDSFWCDGAGSPVLYETPPKVMKLVEKNSAWRYNRIKRRWISPQGKDVELLACNHLVQAIASKFKVEVTERWQHWNGGVFLFNDTSHAFMEAWHQNTLTIFNDPYWKTRDQGSLIATVWQQGLQHQALLPKKFNFIAYFYNPALMISEDKTAISDDAFVTQHQPPFIHVFEHFGDTGWDIWNWIENKVK